MATKVREQGIRSLDGGSFCADVTTAHVWGCMHVAACLLGMILIIIYPAEGKWVCHEEAICGAAMRHARREATIAGGLRQEAWVLQPPERPGI